MPRKLEFSFNSTRLDDFVLDKEIMTIGSKDDNDIRIDNLAVSGHHTKLLTIFDDKTILIRRQPGFNTSPSPNLNEPVNMTSSIEADLNAAKLQILNGKGAGKELALQKPSVKLGKSGAKIVQINSGQMATSSLA
jgi:hypothetical protein